MKVDGEELDLNTATEVASFFRELDMQSGLLKRSFEATLPSGKIVAVQAERLVSIVQDEVGTISYSVTPLNFSGKKLNCART